MDEPKLRESLGRFLSHDSFLVLASDDRFRIEKYPCYLVINTGLSDSNGENWISFVMTSPNSCLYFDSYGEPVNVYPNIIPPAQIFQENCKTLQSDESYTCGHFCIAFIYYLSTGGTYKNFLDHFTHNKEANDNIAFNFVKRLVRKHIASSPKYSKTSRCMTCLCRSQYSSVV